MKAISVGQLRQNPTAALDDVARGETYIITRHRREIGRIVPSERDTPVTPAEFIAAAASTPLPDDSWAEDLHQGVPDEVPDPWLSTS